MKQFLLLLFSCSDVFDSLELHGLQQARLSCPSLSPWVCSNSCPLSWWHHPTISSSVVLFSCLQSYPASRSFPMSHLFTSGGQIIGAWASASVLPMNIQSWFSWIGQTPCSPKDSQESSPSQFENIDSLVFSLRYGPTLASIHDYWKNHSFD